MAQQIQFRRGTSTEWTAANPILAQGEFGLDITQNKFKIGTGLTSWNYLNYGADFVSYASTAGIATNATYATTAGIATNATNATYATSSGIATNATYATAAGIATNATNATNATYSTTAGIATNATNATYATTAGIATVAQGLSGTPNISVGIVTATSYNGPGTNLTGIVTSIVAGTNITVSGSTGQVTINASGSGGGVSQGQSIAFAIALG